MITRKDGVAITLFLFMLVFPLSLLAADLFGNMTFQGKVIDADTLKPIEGAVVVAEWEKCWPGFGAGGVCHFKKAKETLTDVNGEWSITGPEGTYDPGIVRGILGYIVSWTVPPRIHYYKPGYCRYGQNPSNFKAFTYIDHKKGLEGIVLDRPGSTSEESRAFHQTLGANLPFIPAKDPIGKLRSLNFSFQYPKEYMLISLHDLDFPHCSYRVIGLKKTGTIEEWKSAKRFPYSISVESTLPLLEKTIDHDKSWPHTKEVVK